MSTYLVVVAYTAPIGTFWGLAYALILARGFRDRTYGMPAAAMCANLSWEFIYSFIEPSPAPQLYANMLWLAIDVLILVQYLMHWRSDYPANLSPRWFLPMLALMMALAFGATYLASLEFHDRLGVYTAFSGNLMMSILFVTMLLRRNSLAGQSFYIALFKMLGTVAASLVIHYYYAYSPGSLFLGFLYVSIFVMDLVYLVGVYRKYRELALSPWADLVPRGTRAPRPALTAS